MMWLGGVLVLISLVWAIARTWRLPAEEEMPAKVARRPAASAKAATPKSMVPKALAAVPSVMLEEDELEITIVTASPPTLSPPPSAKVPVDASNVNVIYEEDADVDEVTSPMARILVSAAGQSDQGQRRPRNEDSLLVDEERALYVVADGMGGYDGGQVASSLAVEVLRGAFTNNSFEGRIVCDTPVPKRAKEMACAIQMANQAVLKSAQSDRALAKMGTTVVAARFSPNKQRMYLGHVGDSRCYRLRGTKLRQLTTDHTLHELGMRGPGAHQLFQAVGIAPSVKVDLIVDKPRPLDLYLLCSDGLPKMVSDEQVAEILNGEESLEKAVSALVQRANDHGGRDNVTVILVKVLEHHATA